MRARFEWIRRRPALRVVDMPATQGPDWRTMPASNKRGSPGPEEPPSKPERSGQAQPGSEERYRTILENLNDVIFATDTSGVVTYISPAIERLSSYTPADVLGTRFADFVHPDDLDGLMASLMRLMAGIHEPAEFRVRDKNGAVRWVRSSSRLTYHDGEVTGTAGVLTEISQRKNAEAALQESEARYRQLVELSPDGIAVHSDGRFVFVNSAGAALMGAENASQLLGRPVLDVVHPDSRPMVVERMRQMLEEGRPGPRTEEKFVRLDGSVIDVEVGAMPLLYQGRPSVQVVVREITERRRADAALRESEERYRELFENAHDIVYSHDLSGNFLAANRAALKATGYGRDEVLRMNLAQILAPEILPRISTLIAQAGAGAPLPSSLELEILSKDGHRVTLEVSPRIVFEDGRPVALHGIARDVTERNRARAEIQRLNDELEDRVRERTAELETANKELEAFSYSVSHDLRVPLRVIEGFSHLFLQEYGETVDPQARDYIARVHATATRMGQLTRDMLALSRVSRTPMTRRRVDLSAIARSLRVELRQSQPDREVRFDIADDVFADGDPALLRVLMQNLLENAWKYTSKHAFARIEFGTAEREQERVYFVRDDGAGFDMRFVSQLFGPFQRLHPGADFEGTGIGLATVQRIVQRHGGRVWAEGVIEEGATFSFTLAKPRS